MDLFKRVMTVTNPNGAVFLGGSHDDSPFTQTLDTYTEMRKKSPYFRGGTFAIGENGELIKVEMWTSEEEYQIFIEENRQFIRNLVVEYEAYCSLHNMSVERTGSTVSLDSLFEMERRAFNQKDFLK